MYLPSKLSSGEVLFWSILVSPLVFIYQDVSFFASSSEIGPWHKCSVSEHLMYRLFYFIQCFLFRTPGGTLALPCSYYMWMLWLKLAVKAVQVCRVFWLKLWSSRQYCLIQHFKSLFFFLNWPAHCIWKGMVS